MSEGVHEPATMSQARTSEPLLELTGISKSFGATVALDDVGLSVRAGEVHALVGENGAGKSTLMNIVAGALAPDRGAMRVGGRPYAPASPLDARQARIALIHQELSLCPHLTVAENILLGVEPRRLGWLDRAEGQRRAAAVLEQFGHPDIALDRTAGDCRWRRNRWWRSSARCGPTRASCSWTSRRAACPRRTSAACSP